MARPVPDLDGFEAAQDHLIDEFGQDLTWYKPNDPTWPAGTPIDPETGKPYDPTIEPESGGGFTEVVVRAAPINNLTSGSQDSGNTAESTQVGYKESGGAILSVKYADWQNNGLDDATEVSFRGDRYKIVLTRDDKTGERANPQRMLAYTRQM